MRIKYLFTVLILILSFGCSKSMIRFENNYAIDMLRQDVDKEAEFRWLSILEDDPNDWVAYNNLGVCYEKQGRFELALAYYEIALSIVKKNRGVEENYKRLSEMIYEN